MDDHAVVGADLGHPSLALVEQVDGLPYDAEGVFVTGRQLVAPVPQFLDLLLEVAHGGHSNVRAMADLDALLARLERLEELIRQTRPAALPSGRTEVTAEVRSAVASGQKGVTARLDDVWTAITEGTEKILATVARLEVPAAGDQPDVDLSPVIQAVGSSGAEIANRLEAIRARLGADPVPAIDALSARVSHLEQAVAEAIRNTPRVTGALEGVPERLAEPLESIDTRLAAVERMAREQFELDQRLQMVDDTLQGLTGPFNELLPNLRHVAGIVEWLGRIEERLQSVATQLGPLVLRSMEPPELARPPELAPGPMEADEAELPVAQPVEEPAPVPAVDLEPVQAALASLMDRLGTVAASVADLSAAAPGAHLAALAIGLAPIEARLSTIASALEDREVSTGGGPVTSPAPVDLSAVEARMASIESVIGAFGGPLVERLGALQEAIEAHHGDPEAASRLEALAEGLERLREPLDARLQRLDTALQSSAAPLEARLAQLEQAVSRLAEPIEARLVRLEQAASLASTAVAAIAPRLASGADSVRQEVAHLREATAAESATTQAALNRLAESVTATVETATTTTVEASAIAAEARDVLETQVPPLVTAVEAVRSRLDDLVTSVGMRVAPIEQAVRDTRADVSRTRDEAAVGTGETTRRFDQLASGLSRLGHEVEVTQQRMIDLDRKIGVLRSDLAEDDRVARAVYQAAEAMTKMAAAVETLDRRLDAELDTVGRRLDSMATAFSGLVDELTPEEAPDVRARTADTVAQRLNRLRDMAAGLSDAARSELRRRRGGQNQIGPGEGG